MSPGDFIWHELWTSRPATAAEFYAELFGWQACASDGDFVMHSEGYPAARLRTTVDQPTSGWLPAIEVADLDTAVEWATAHRGTVLPRAVGRRGPQDRSAAISHPSAGEIQLLRPAGKAMTTSTAFDWHLLDTPELDDAAWCYGVLAGWVVALVSQANEGTPSSNRDEGADVCSPYEKIAIARGRTARPVATLTPAPSALAPAWLPYKQVDDIDKAARRTVELGGRLIAEFADLAPIGASCLLRDPDGNPFACFQPT